MTIINHNIFKATLLLRVFMCELNIFRLIHTWKMMGKKIIVMFLSAQKATLHAPSVMLLFSFSLIFLQ